jgi:hypothetical protein
MLWSHIPPKETFQDFAEEGVEHFKHKYGYSPTKIEYYKEDGTIDIPGILCVGMTGNVQPGCILIYPAEERT